MIEHLEQRMCLASADEVIFSDRINTDRAQVGVQQLRWRETWGDESRWMYSFELDGTYENSPLECEASFVQDGTIIFPWVTDQHVSVDEAAKIVNVLIGRLVGDANGDSRVDSRDFSALAQHFNQAAAAPGFAVGDFNNDGVVNAIDFNQLASNYGK